MTRHTILLPDGARLWLTVNEPDGTTGTVDLDADTAELVADRGLDEPAASDEHSVELGAVNADGDVTATLDGNPITTDALLAAISAGVVGVLRDALSRPAFRSGDR